MGAIFLIQMVIEPASSRFYFYCDVGVYKLFYVCGGVVFTKFFIKYKNNLFDCDVLVL